MSNQDKEHILLNKESGKEFTFSHKPNIGIVTTLDGFTFIKTTEGIQYPVEIVSRHQNEYELLINGVSCNFSIETPFSLERKKHLAWLSTESTTIRVKAPMPGKILEVMVKTGDTLLILEAMKMQNAILASTKGIIKKY